MGAPLSDSAVDALVMCGGRGTRLDAAVEKPLLRVCGEPMVDRVVAALDDAPVGTVRAVVSPHAPETRAHLDGRVPLVETPGEGYVADLGTALDRVGRPAVTVAADLPLLAAGHVERALDAHAAADGASVTVCVPAALKRRLGVSVDTTLGGGELAPAGLNVVGDVAGEETVTEDDPRLAVNVNRPSDAAVAEALCD